MAFVFKTGVVKAGLLFLVLLNAGCAAQNLASHWQRDGFIADGSENEWPTPPQYYDADSRAVIYVMNDAEAVYLCLAANNEALKRKMLIDGLTLWLDPTGKKHKALGIHLTGVRPPRHSGAPGENALRRNKNKRPVLQTPKAVEITFSEATAPRSMSMDRIRRTGIDIGAGQPDSRRFVYEFKIPFAAAPSLSGLDPGTALGIGIETGKPDNNSRMRKPPEGTAGKGTKRGGGMRGGSGRDRPGGGSSSRAMAEPFETWIKVTLADRAVSQPMTGD